MRLTFALLIFFKIALLTAQTNLLFGKKLDANDKFGTSTAISDSLFFVSSTGDDDYAFDSGAVFVFKKYASDYKQIQKIKALDPEDYNNFGASIDVNKEWLIVGSPGNSEIKKNSGAVYIFRHLDGEWVDDVKLVPNNLQKNEGFGSSVSITDNYAVIGTLNNKAYVFKLFADTWRFLKEIKGPNDYKDNFGFSVAISDPYLAIGAFRDSKKQPTVKNGKKTEEDCNNCGMVYFYKRFGVDWQLKNRVRPKDIKEYDWFGYSLDLDGKNAIISSKNNDEKAIEGGSAYHFQYNGIKFVEKEKITSNITKSQDHFGEKIAMKDNFLIVSALDGNKSKSYSGSVYIYQLNTAGWQFLYKYTSTEGNNYDLFGNSVSIDKNHILIGSIGNKTNGTSSGTSYIINK